jgi:hypothetical protein
MPGARLILIFDRLPVKFRRLSICRPRWGRLAKNLMPLGAGRMKLSKHRMLTVATDRAERFRPILDEFAALPAAAAAAALNGCNVPSPRGGRWYAAQVIRMRKRLATGPRRKTRKGEHSQGEELR